MSDFVKFSIDSSESKRVYLPSVAGAWMDILYKIPWFEQNMKFKALEKKYPNRGRDDSQDANFSMETITMFIKDWNLSDDTGAKIPLERALDIVKQLPLADLEAIQEPIHEKKK